MGRLERIVGCEGRQMMEVAVEGLGGHRPGTGFVFKKALISQEE